MFCVTYKLRAQAATRPGTLLCTRIVSSCFLAVMDLPSVNLNLGTLIFPEFTGLNEEVVIKILQQLQKDEKAELIQMDDGYGVKFF